MRLVTRRHALLSAAALLAMYGAARVFMPRLHLAWLLVLAGSIVSGALLERWYAKLRQPKPDPSSQLKL